MQDIACISDTLGSYLYKYLLKVFFTCIYIYLSVISVCYLLVEFVKKRTTRCFQCIQDYTTISTIAKHILLTNLARSCMSRVSGHVFPAVESLYHVLGCSALLRHTSTASVLLTLLLSLALLYIYDHDIACSRYIGLPMYHIAG